MTLFVGIVRYEIDDKNCIGVGGEATVFLSITLQQLRFTRIPTYLKKVKYVIC